MKHPITISDSKNYNYNQTVKNIGNLTKIINQMKKEIQKSEDDYILSILESMVDK